MSFEKSLKNRILALIGALSFIMVLTLMLTRCGQVYDPFANSKNAAAREIVKVPVSFSSGATGLDLATALSDVYLSITGCSSGYTQSNFLFNGSTVNFYLNDTGCLLSICSFTYNSENYTTACSSFNTTVGALTTFTGTGGANPGGDTVYAYVGTQITGPITGSVSASFYILENDNFSNFNLPITTNVIQISNNTPSSAPYTVPAASTSSVQFGFKLLYPNPPPSTAVTVNYSVVGSAVAGTDYTAPSGSVTIPANASTATATVTLLTTNTQARETQSLGLLVAGSSGFQGSATYVGYGNPAVMITNTSTAIPAVGNPGLAYQGTPTTITPSTGTVTSWADASGSGLGVAFTASGSPTVNTGVNGINNLSAIQFSGSNYLRITSNRAAVNSATSYASKLISMVFQTSSDVTTRQILFNQGTTTDGINLYIYNGQLYANRWAASGSSNVASAYILPNSAYSASLYFSSTNTVLKLYISGVQVDQVTIPSTALARSNNTNSVGIGGGAGGGAKFENNTTTTAVQGFQGEIAEILYFNNPVYTDVQIRGVHGYLDAKYALTYPAVTISAANANMGENDSFAKGFLITRSIPTSSPLTVYYTTSGTAIAGTHYTVLPGSVTIPAYNSSVYTYLSPINNGTIGDTHTLTMTLANDAGNGTSPQTYIGAPNSASLNIVDYVAPTSATLISWLNAALGVTTAGGNVSTWTDQSGKAISATGASSHFPTSVTSSTPNYINFNGTSTANAQDFSLATSALLDSAASYTQKTFAFVFRTGTDVATRQIIYKQGSSTNGMNIVISGGNIYFTGYGTGWGTSPNSISAAVSASTIYEVIFEFDQVNGQLRGKMNRSVITPVTTGVGTLTGVATSTAIGANKLSSIRFFDNTTTSTANANFLVTNSRIYEVLLFNGILNSDEFSTLEKYLLNKYGL